MKDNYLYSISQASAQTGIPAYLIRVWESRYSAVTPMRSNGNRRFFCANDIKRLKLLSKAVDSGHSISQVAALSQEELAGIVKTDPIKIRHRFKENKSDSPRAETYYQKSLRFVAELDADGLQSCIGEAAVNLTRPAMIFDVVLPLYNETNRLVQTGKLRLINLNAVTSILQAFLWDLLKTTVVSESAPKIGVGTPSDHRSEIGALAMALIAVESGYRSLYFGSNLPANDLAAAVKFKGAQAVAMFTEKLQAQSTVESEVKKLRGKLDDDIAILVCTNENSDAAELLKREEVLVTTLKKFRKVLENLTQAKIARQFVTMEDYNNEMVN